MVYYWNDRWHHYMEFDAVEWWMINHYSYYRRLRVQQERKDFYKASDLSKEYGFQLVRPGRAPHSLDPWDIEARATKADSKSWKAMNRCRKHWGKKKYGQYLE